MRHTEGVKVVSDVLFFDSRQGLGVFMILGCLWSGEGLGLLSPWQVVNNPGPGPGRDLQGAYCL